MSSNDLVERYVHAVGARLPKGERDDVAPELHSLIEDMLAERAAEQGGVVDEPLTVAALRELGQPDVVAERYGQPRPHLVGPDYYPAFKVVISIVAAVLGVLFLVATVTSLAFSHRPPDEVLSGLVQSLLQFGTTLMANVGLIALIFAAIERAAPKPEAAADDWDPRELPAVTDPDRLDRGSEAFELGFNVAALVLFNYVLYWQVPVFVIGEGEVARVWLDFTPAFMAWVPWINATFVLDIALHMVLLWRGRWELGTRLADVAVNLFSAYVVLRVLTLEHIAVAPWLDLVCKIGAAVVLVIVLLEVAQQVYKLLRSSRTAANRPVGDVATRS